MLTQLHPFQRCWSLRTTRPVGLCQTEHRWLEHPVPRIAAPAPKSPGKGVGLGARGLRWAISPYLYVLPDAATSNTGFHAANHLAGDSLASAWPPENLTINRPNREPDDEWRRDS